MEVNEVLINYLIILIITKILKNDQECRKTEFFFIDFAKASFISGNESVVEMPEPVDAACIPSFDPNEEIWRYDFTFDDCGIG